MQIETNNGTISSQTCILTVSTGVLSSGKLKFIPTLPMEKYDSFSGISMGIYNHIALQFKNDFFPHETDGYIYYKLNREQEYGILKQLIYYSRCYFNKERSTVT